MSETVWAAVSAALIIEGCMMNVLVVDVGGTHVKILATGKKEKREFASGPRLTAPQMVLRVRKLAQDWKYQAVSIGYPGPDGI
jgi:polyphosphate glucokinase